MINYLIRKMYMMFVTARQNTIIVPFIFIRIWDVIVKNPYLHSVISHRTEYGMHSRVLHFQQQKNYKIGKLSKKPYRRNL